MRYNKMSASEFEDVSSQNFHLFSSPPLRGGREFDILCAVRRNSRTEPCSSHSGLEWCCGVGGLDGVGWWRVHVCVQLSFAAQLRMLPQSVPCGTEQLWFYNHIMPKKGKT